LCRFCSRLALPALHAITVLWFAGAGNLTIFIGWVFLYASVQHLGAVRASAVKRLNPLFSVMLGVLLLGESFDVAILIGMLLIGSSFAVLIRQSLKARGAEQEGGAGQAADPSWGVTLANLGFFYGPVSALAYAFGCVARKQGLILMPDPTFGTVGVGGGRAGVCLDGAVCHELPDRFAANLYRV
jgi:drug/metabolite transporter (DMT)-like permease